MKFTKFILVASILLGMMPCQGSMEQNVEEKIAKQFEIWDKDFQLEILQSFDIQDENGKNIAHGHYQDTSVIKILTNLANYCVRRSRQGDITISDLVNKIIKINITNLRTAVKAKHKSDSEVYKIYFGTVFKSGFMTKEFLENMVKTYYVTIQNEIQKKLSNKRQQEAEAAAAVATAATAKAKLKIENKAALKIQQLYKKRLGKKHEKEEKAKIENEAALKIQQLHRKHLNKKHQAHVATLSAVLDVIAMLPKPVAKKISAAQKLPDILEIISSMQRS